MNLDQQIQALIDNAPQDGETPEVVKAIAPALKLIAGQLRHSRYYISQTFNQEWLLTVLSNRANPGVEKHVIYAFPTLEDAKAAPNAVPESQGMALPVPVVHILFQIVAMENVDSAVFFETPGNLAEGTEVRREDLQNLMEYQLEQTSPSPRIQPSHLPDDIA